MSDDAAPAEAPPPPPSKEATGSPSGGGGAFTGLLKPCADELHHHVVPTERCGALNVYVEGDLEEAHKDTDSKCVFLTIHDVLCNHTSIKKFVDSEAFEEISKRAIFVHVDVPGHEQGAPDLAEGSFPVIQYLGEDLVTVLNQLRIKYVIGLGDGAGANIMARFAMMNSARCMGVILLHPTSNKATMVRNFKDKFSKWKLSGKKTNVEEDVSGEDLAVFRKFGHKLEDAEDKDKALEEFRKTIGGSINKKNMKMYVDAYANRKDITSQLSTGLKCDALLVVGSKTSHVAAAEHMYQNLNKTKSSLLKIDGVGNVLEEAPVKLANSILLFCKGLGWLTSVTLPGVERRRSLDGSGKPIRQRSISMEDYDKPNIRRLSISSKD